MIRKRMLQIVALRAVALSDSACQGECSGRQGEWVDGRCGWRR